jgi:hypothetical protein
MRSFWCLLLVGCHLRDPGGLPTDFDLPTVTHLSYDLPGYDSWSGEATGTWKAQLDETYCALSEFVSAGTYATECAPSEGSATFSRT